MRITRREFLKYCTVAAGALGLTQADLLKLNEVMAKEGGAQVVWLHGASCTGDSTSLLNTIFYTDPVGLLVTGDLDLQFHQTVMNTSGTDLALATDSLDEARALLPTGIGLGTYAEWSSDTWSGGSESIKLVVGDRSDDSLRALAEIAPAGRVLINEFDMSFKFKTGEEQAPFIELDVVNQDTGVTETISSHYPGVTADPWTDPPTPGYFGPTDWRSLRLSDFFLWTDSGGNPPPPTALPDTDQIVGNEISPYQSWWSLRNTYGTWIVESVRIIDQGNTIYAPVTDSCTMYIDDIVIAGRSYGDRDAAITLSPTAASGGQAFVLVVEGSVVTGTPPNGTHAGEYCEVGPMVAAGDPDETMLHAFLTYARYAAAVIAVGTCASFGGIPRLGETGAKGCAQVLNDNGISTPVINVPGCPAHPDWIVGTVAAYLARGLDGIDLDSNLRPRDFYGNYVCNGNGDVPCTWRYNNDRDENGPDDTNYPVGESRGLAKYKWGSVAVAGESYTDYDTTTAVVTFTQYHMFEGCLGVLGCRGRKTHADCAYRKWNAMTTLVPGSVGVNWCVGSRGGCQGCTEPDFPLLKRFYTFV